MQSAAACLVVPGDPAPSQVDARCFHLGLFGNGMQVVLLELTLHRADVSMRNREDTWLPNSVWCPLLLFLDSEISRGSKRQAQNASIACFGIEEGLVVCVPTHGIMTIPVKVDVASIRHLVLLVASQSSTCLADLGNELWLGHWRHLHTRVLVRAAAAMVHYKDSAARHRSPSLLVLRVAEVCPREVVVQLLEPLPRLLLVNRLGAEGAKRTSCFIFQHVVPVWIPLLAFHRHGGQRQAPKRGLRSTPRSLPQLDDSLHHVDDPVMWHSQLSQCPLICVDEKLSTI
mmetsp:Transcript_27359/g.63830  ORF Transcript_27359/g.63830 Transcript_27359/m.63830 type:complete len:286 (+) Transcript_27359:262-1119(+)